MRIHARKSSKEGVLQKQVSVSDRKNIIATHWHCEPKHQYNSGTDNLQTR